MTGFTANLSNYPPGTWAGDPQAPWNERDHHQRCVFHPDYNGPNLACTDDHFLRESDFVKLAGDPPKCPVWYSATDRCGAPCREIPCSCDEETQADAEDAAERRGDEMRDNGDV